MVVLRRAAFSRAHLRVESDAMNPIQPHLLFALAVAMCLPALAAGAATVYVSPTGSDSTGSGTSAAPFKSVTMAVSKASAGSTISIAPGEYTEPGTVSISSALTLQGSGPVQSPSPITAEASPLKPSLDALCAEQPCITTATADRVFEVTGAASSTVVFTDLAVLGPNRSASVGSSSFGMVVDGVGVELNNVTILAGVGGAGQKGIDGGSAGYNPPGGMGGACQAPKQVYDPCPCFSGFPGKPALDASGNTVKGGGRGWRSTVELSKNCEVGYLRPTTRMERRSRQCRPVSTRGGKGGRGNIGGRAGSAGTIASSGEPGPQQTRGTFPAP
ncbi:MAG: DUF1565 domain-containing protein [Variovorax sp.]|nr:MAG: DUF1565 domain-containing protein [Variovorax sp.]